MPADQVKKIIIATLSLTTKVQRTPNMTAIYDKMNTIRNAIN